MYCNTIIYPYLYEVEMRLILCRICSPFFAIAEKGAGGMSTCKAEKYSQLLLFIPDSQ
jgi:hypothetical protein